jgi:hypothetical protein
VATRTPSNIVQTLVIRGLVIGYSYAILLSASAIAVCETKRPGECSEVWNQGFSTATGLVTTFLAYLIPPTGTTSPSSRKGENTDASA